MIHHDADWRWFCFTRWLSACLGMRRSWSLTPCLQGSLKTSYTASAAPTASERPCCSRSSSSTLAGSSPTTQSCSVACWRSVLGTLSPLLSDKEFHSLNLNNKACSCHTIIISILHRSFLAIIYIGYLKQSLFVMPMFSIRWIFQAMKHELKIRAGDMPPRDIYQMSPSDVKQLLLDVLQPQQTGRCRMPTICVLV